MSGEVSHESVISSLLFGFILFVCLAVLLVFLLKNGNRSVSSEVFSLKRRIVWGELIAGFRIQRGLQERWGRLFSRACCDQLRGGQF